MTSRPPFDPIDLRYQEAYSHHVELAGRARAEGDVLKARADALNKNSDRPSTDADILMDQATQKYAEADDHLLNAEKYKTLQLDHQKAKNQFESASQKVDPAPVRPGSVRDKLDDVTHTRRSAESEELKDSDVKEIGKKDDEWKIRQQLEAARRNRALNKSRNYDLLKAKTPEDEDDLADS